MRWVVVHPGPSWSVADVHNGWVEALRELGEQVHVFNLDDRLTFYDHALVDVGDPAPDGRLKLKKALTAEQAKELAADGLASTLWKLRPDVLLVICGFLVPPDLLDHARRHGTRVLILHTESPYELDRELAMAGHADLNLISDPVQIDRFNEVAPTVWAPHAYRPSVHHPGPAVDRIRCDLAFVGTGFGSRRWFFEQMHAAGALDGLDVLLAGNWQGLADDSPLRPFIGADDPAHCLDNDRAADIYRSARVGINLYRREHDDGAGNAAGWAVGPREVELAACGAFFLRDPRPEGDALFPMLPTFAGPAEAAELLTWWLRHPDRRAEAAELARTAVEDRTFTASASKLLRLFDREPVTV